MKVFYFPLQLYFIATRGIFVNHVRLSG